MKKIIITITVLVLIALGFILYRHYASTHLMDGMENEANSAVVVKDFIDMMIPHHAEAVRSSTQVMKDLDITDPALRIFAANVVDEQSSEIEHMRNIYREYLGMDYRYSSTTYKEMMSDTSTLKGDELGKVYVKEMIQHHEDAIKMAKEYIAFIDKKNKANTHSENGISVTNSHPAVDETYAIAQHIIDSQTKELETLKKFYK